MDPFHNDLPNPNFRNDRPFKNRGQGGYVLLIMLVAILAFIPMILTLVNWVQKHAHQTVQAIVTTEEQYAGRSAIEEARRQIRSTGYLWNPLNTMSFTMKLEDGVSVDVQIESDGFQ